MIVGVLLLKANLMQKIFLLVIAIVACHASICSQPQRKLYMSYPTLSKRDSLTNLFTEISTKMTPIDSNYTDSGLQANFKIPSLKAAAYYNNHHQAETYLDKFKVNVTMGDLVIASQFNYTIVYASNNKSGVIHAKGRIDPSFFTKQLNLQNGELKWEPGLAPSLTFTQFFLIEYSQPKLSQAQLNIFMKMLNNQAGTRKIKTEIVNQINLLYPSILKVFLNHEDLIGPNNITYKYRNFTLNLWNQPKDFYMSNMTTKGLQVFLIYGLNSSTENCTNLGKEFDQNQYGGYQEIISFGIVRSMVKQAISNGLYDVVLDRSWQVPTFQFYMGDLGNFVSYANYAPAGDRFNASCKFDPSSRNEDLKIVRYDDQDIYISTPMTCQIDCKGKNIIRIKMDVIIVGRVVVGENSINVVVHSTNIFGVSFTSIDPSYKIDDLSLGKYFIGEILNGLIGKSVFGSGFSAIYRKYPAIRILEDRIILYDPSEL